MAHPNKYVIGTREALDTFLPQYRGADERELNGVYMREAHLSPEDEARAVELGLTVYSHGELMLMLHPVEEKPKRQSQKRKGDHAKETEDE